VRALFLLEDEPVETLDRDGLDLRAFASIVSGAAVGTRGPFTIGVFGGWGTGKTSVLRLAKTEIDGSTSKNVVTVWFNAWQYEHDQHPIVPLVASIVDQLQARLIASKSGTERVSEIVQRGWSKLTNVLRAVIYGIEAKAKVAVPGLGDVEVGLAAKEMIDRYEDVSRAADPLVERTLYYNAFEVLRRSAPNPPEGRVDENVGKIVVFIDDLDRCLPEKAVRLLESIKLVLTQKGFIFVFALDRPVVERYIDVALRRSLDDAEFVPRGAKYLDKIFQLPLELPSHSARFAKYVSATMRRDIFTSGAENKSLAKVVEPLVKTIGAAIDYNPRSFVRLVNNLLVDLRLLPPDHEKDTEKQVALFAVTRLLRYGLTVDQFDYLVGPDAADLRKALEGGRDEGKRHLDKSPTRRTDKSKTRQQRLLIQLRATFDERPQLLELLVSEAGKRWLEDNDGRNRVIHFIRETRKEPADAGRAGGGGADVTQRLRGLVKNDKLSAKANNDVLGGDPAVGIIKQLTVTYSVAGKIHVITVREGETLEIPQPGDGAGALEITSAMYAAPDWITKTI